MKYLKTYESLNSEDIQTIKDILLEVEDMGFETKVGKAAYYWRITIGKSIRENAGIIPPYIEFDDIRDCVLRLKDYAGDRFREFDYGIYTRYGLESSEYLDWTTIKLNEDTIISKPINIVCLWIKYKEEL